MQEFILGIIFGVFGVFFAVFAVLDKSKRLQLSKVPQQWPAELEDYLRKSLSKSEDDHSVGDLCMSPTVDISWMNLMLIRYFLSLRSSEAYKEYTLVRISNKMNSSLKNGLLVIS